MEIKKANMKNESFSPLIYKHIKEDSNWAIVSTYNGNLEDDENKKRISSLKSEVRNMNYGFIQFVSRWVDNNEAFDEDSLFIPKLTYDKAVSLGKEFGQSSIIVCDENGCREVCTAPFETYSDGDVVRTFNIDRDNPMNMSDAEEFFSKRKGGPASIVNPDGNGKKFHLSEVYEVEQPRPSYFQTGYHYTKIFPFNK